MSNQSVTGNAGVIVRAALVAVMAVAVYRAVLVAWADLVFRQSTPAAIEKAERLVPANATYHYTRALVLEQNDPTSPEIEREFAKAVSVNPRYSDALMAWSVEREMRGDQAGSERLLLQAQRRDHLLRPAWALANYYYRQGDTDRLLAEARECLRIIGVSGVSEGRFAITPVYELCWKSGASAETILSKGIPDIPIILGGYLSYVLHTGRASAGPAIVARMMPTAEPGEMFFLRPYLDDLISRNQVALAAQTWRQLYMRGIVPYSGPNIVKGVFLTNGELGGAPLDYGFDWRRMFPDSVQFSYSRLEHSYRFDFDGAEPEKLELVEQVLPLQPDRSYRFLARFESDLNPEQSGLRWSIRDHGTGKPVKTLDTIKADGDFKTLEMTFDSPLSLNSGNLALTYQREPGTARLHGYYRLLSADLKLR